MSAVAAALAASAQRRLPADEAVFRDDGPLAAWLGRTAGARLALPPLALLGAGVIVLLAVAAATGADASPAVAGATLAWLILAAGVTSGRLPGETFRWAVPPLVRLGEYAALVWIAAVDGTAALPAAFALLAALAFRHYDLVYRLRFRHEVPPAWLNLLAGGWDGRLLIAWVLLVAGALPVAMFAWAGLLGAVSLAEAVAGWRRFGREGPQFDDGDEEDDGG